MTSRQQQRLLLGLATAILCCWAHVTSSAAPVGWPVEDGGNGHWYEIVSPPDGITWQAANVAAANSSFMGTSITSSSVGETHRIGKTPSTH